MFLHVIEDDVLAKKNKEKLHAGLHISKKSSNFAADFDNEDGFDCLQPRKKMLKIETKAAAWLFFC